MTLTRGTTYDTTALRLTGWTDGDGTGSDGYHVDDYFRDGVYLGPDPHGIEPDFRPAEVASPKKQKQKHKTEENNECSNREVFRYV